MKRVWFVMLMVAFVVQAAAATDYLYATVDGRQWCYYLTDQGAVVSGHWQYWESDDDCGSYPVNAIQYSASTITVPSTIGGYTVIGIGELAFTHKTGITKLIIPSTVVSIADHALTGCEGLCLVVSPTLPPASYRGYYDSYDDDVCDGTYDETDPYNGYCHKTPELASVLNGEGQNLYVFRNTALKSIAKSDFLSSIEIIPDYAFGGLSSLTNVVIPTTVKSIGKYVFSGCTKLSSVSMPSACTEISEGLFNNCSSLKSFTVPSGVTSIGRNAFNGTGLTSMSLSSDCPLI